MKNGDKRKIQQIEKSICFFLPLRGFVTKVYIDFSLEISGNSRVLGKDFRPGHLGIDTKEYFR